MQSGEQPTGPTAVGEGEQLRAETFFAIPKIYKPTAVATLKTKQSWEGTVLWCDASAFTARVIDRTSPENPAESVLFDFDEVSEDDRQLIHPGAVFYWTLGTERSPAGQVRNVNFVNFRRLPTWSQSSFREAAVRAGKVLALLSQE